MKLSVLLADSAQAGGDGKVHALGIGWSTIGTPTAPMSVIVLSDLDEEDRDDQYSFTVTLCGGDGDPYQFETETGKHALSLDITLPAPPPNGVPGARRLAAVANLGPGLLLPPGSYHWVATIGGSDLRGDTTFTVVPKN
ncbi:DUF6941 family protein [Nocardia sp. alder85J]|uniref:DUF6941 family protein n=1 Tax=Nocardia sp. alder85J TaxID=2862949 RepID=UPI001CD3EDA2|nr:hypothetical protein [Nocardia sp. alder85J]MCX4095949.1 hypothetical protein [Nocardia sp. alder85J]